MTRLEKEIAHLQELQAKHRKNIRALEEQLANYGMDRPLPLLNNLDFEREQLRQVEEQLAALTAHVEAEEHHAARGVAVGDEVHGDKVGGDKVAGDKITVTGDFVFQTFAQAPVPLSRHVRLREFQTLVTERTKRFVGRDFIFNAIDDLLKDSAFSSGYIVISGEPGIGKTALIAELVKRKGYVHHFNIASQNIRHARDFLANVCAQLIVRYELEHYTLPPEATQNSGFLSQLLFEATEAERDQPVVILVDALDEAEDTGLAPGANILYLPPALPPGVYFVVTTRTKTDFRLFVDRHKGVYMHDDDPCNLEDVRQYIRNFAEEYQDQVVPKIEQWGVKEDEFVEVITEKSEGNFMYLVYVLSDIRDGKLTVENVDNVRDLPKGLQAYYQRHWRQMREGNEHEFDAVYEPIVCILAVVQEPVTVEQVAAWTKLSRGQVKRAIGLWYEFLEEELVDSERRYRIYHASFQDFLKEQVDLVRCDDMIADYYLSSAGLG